MKKQLLDLLGFNPVTLKGLRYAALFVFCCFAIILIASPIIFGMLYLQRP